MGESNKVTNWRKISINRIIGILLYYCILFILGTFITLKMIILSSLDTGSLLDNNISYIFLNKASLTLNYENIALIGSLGSSLLGSSIYYIRTLYKLCIENQFIEPTKSNNDRMQSLGTLIYFLLRPFFALAFSILVIIGIETSILSLTSEKIQLGNSFPSICIFLNFFIGFSSGKFLKSLEKKSESIINNIMNTNTKKEEI